MDLLALAAFLLGNAPIQSFFFLQIKLIAAVKVEIGLGIFRDERWGENSISFFHALLRRAMKYYHSSLLTFFAFH